MTGKNTILIIGKTGQLGGSLMNKAPEFGFEAVGYGREELDICDAAEVKKKIEVLNPSVVINASAYHVMRDCEEHPERAYAVNTLAVASVAEICRTHGARFITYSTDYVFDGTKGSPYTEDDCPHPLQVYGVSKLAGEYEARNKYPEGTIVIRTCGLYGGLHGSPMKGGNFVLNILKEADGKDSIDVSEDQVVSPTFSDDLAGATYELLVRNGACGVYHLVNEGMCGWSQFTEEIFRIANINTRVVPVVRGHASGGAARPLFSALANTRAKVLGIVLPPWQDGLERYLAGRIST